MTRYIGRMLLLALALTLIIAGCGESNNNDQSGSLVTGGGSADAVAVRIGEAGFPSSVTQFRVSVFSTSAQLLGTETVPRGQGDQTVSILGVPRGNAIVRIEALNADGSTQSFFSSQVIVPLATGVLNAPSTSFNTGAAPSPTPVPSPSFPSPTPVPSAPTTPSPTPAFSPLPVVSPGASPSPGSSPVPGGSPSPGSSPAASPLPSPGGSPSPFAFPSVNPTTSPSPGASPNFNVQGSFTMQGTRVREPGSSFDRTDWVAAGLSWVFTTGVNNTTMTMFQAPGPSPAPLNLTSIDVNVRGIPNPPPRTSETNFGVRLAAINGQNLTVGSYPNARRFATATNPGLDISGDGRGNNQVFGNFTILDLVKDANGRVVRLSVDLEVHGESPDNPATHAQVRVFKP